MIECFGFTPFVDALCWWATGVGQRRVADHLWQLDDCGEVSPRLLLTPCDRRIIRRSSPFGTTCARPPGVSWQKGAAGRPRGAFDLLEVDRVGRAAKH